LLLKMLALLLKDKKREKLKRVSPLLQNKKKSKKLELFKRFQLRNKLLKLHNLKLRKKPLLRLQSLKTKLPKNNQKNTRKNKKMNQCQLKKFQLLFKDGDQVLLPLFITHYQ